MGKFGKNIIIRTISGATLLVAVFGAVYFSEYSFAALFLVVGLGTMREFYRIAGQSGARPQKNYSMILGAAMIIISFLVAAGYVKAVYLAGLLPLTFTVLAAELYRKDTGTHLKNAAVSLMGVFYGAIPASLILFMGLRDGYDPSFVIAYISIVWVNDVFAYLVGTSIGKHRLFERISPKKSWEGFFGGLVFTVSFAILCGHWFGQNLWIWAGFGAVAAISSVFGDLVESMFKREAGVKDSGSIMPGHGGFMDRFDALLFSAPFVFVYFYFFL